MPINVHKLATASCLLTISLFSCNQGTRVPERLPNQIMIGDPLQSPNAPIFVPFKEITKILQPQPFHYPFDAKSYGVQGDVLVEVWIDSDGKPIKSASLFGPKELLQFAADYVLSWRFKPFLQNGKSIPVRFRFVMPFHLYINAGRYQTLPKNLVY